jgi:hypothetical protein
VAIVVEQYDVGKSATDIDGQPGRPALLTHHLVPFFEATITA